MSVSLNPDYKFENVQEITPEFLKGKGISLLLLDLDNTLAPYGKSLPTEEVIKWSDNMKKNGITPFIVSNNRTVRAQIYADIFGIGYIDKSGKPRPKGVRRAMELCGKSMAETALCGDQIFTDVLAANSAGVTAILVEPIALKNPLHFIRFLIEKPFRKRTKEEA